MTIKKKETELTDFLKSIPEDPLVGGRPLCHNCL